jgi:hypothetical protein
MSSQEKVVVNTYTYVIEAETAAMLLRQNEIESDLLNDETVNSNPFLSNAVGGIKLVVNQEDLDNAIMILNEDEKKRNNDHGKYCYRCESNDVEIIKTKTTWKTILIIILSLGTCIPWIFKEFKCRKCGHKW